MTIATRLAIIAAACAAGGAGVSAASAKGELPSRATITGPRLSKAVVISDEQSLAALETHSGFFQAVMRDDARPMLPGRPAGALGPHYVATYLVPRWRWHRGGVATAILRQDLYPYAQGGALSFVEPGQPYFNSFTRGGWYRGGTVLEKSLVRSGLPARETARGFSPAKALALALAILGPVCFAAVALTLARRRRRYRRTARVAPTA